MLLKAYFARRWEHCYYNTARLIWYKLPVYRSIYRELHLKTQWPNFWIIRNIEKKKKYCRTKEELFACFSLHLQKTSNQKKTCNQKTAFLSVWTRNVTLLVQQLSLHSPKMFSIFFSVDTKIHKRALGRLIWWFPGLEEIPQQLPRFFVN